MIVQLTGTLVEVLPTHVVLDVGGVGYELGVSSRTAQALPAAGDAGVTLLSRLVVKEGSIELFGFATAEERAVFDRLVAISGVGPKLALSVLSTFSPSELAGIVGAQDVAGLSKVPGIGKRKAQRLLVELEGVFAQDPTLKNLAGRSEGGGLRQGHQQEGVDGVLQETTEALLSMGFTSQEASLALEGAKEAGAITPEKAVAYALKRLGGGA